MEIDVLSGKGGTGKTTVSLHLAAKFAAETADVLVVDLDPQRSASDWYEFATSEGFSGFRVSKTAGPADVVIYDHPPLLTSRPRGAMSVLVVQPSLFDYRAAQRAHASMRDVRILDVLTRYNASRTEDREILAALAPAAVISDRSIYKRVLSAGMSLYDNRITNYYGTRDARDEVNKLYASVCDFYLNAR